MSSNDTLQPAADILVVDDTPDNLRLLATMLKREGFAVRAAANGPQALQEAAQKIPDLVLLDVTMPVMDGYEVCRRFKATQEMKSVPVVFISALVDPLDKVMAFDCGGVDYVTKPFEFEEVRARVNTHLKVRKLQAELEHQNRHLEEIVQDRTRALADAHRRLEVLDEAKTDFLNLISHELNTPLNGLLGITEMVFDMYRFDPALTEFRSLFNLSRDRMTNILNDALLLTQIQAGDPALKAESSSLRSLLDGAVTNTALFANSRQIAIQTALEDALVAGEPQLLLRVFSAVLETAIKFSKDSHPVRLEVVAVEPAVWIQIEARGRQIPADVLPNFFRVFAITRTITPGGDIGLGPALACRILHLYGGTIAVENLNPAGVRFQITLPKAAAAQR